ncbi:MAG: protein-glutamate O-methyltransferase CheR [Firmicutes bacterium]|nr:protein-glutamate O-methyltransferase CheR [Bacillota bacterium]
MLQLDNNDFKRLVTYIKDVYGIDLTQKRQLIVGRLSNSLVSMGYTSFGPYIDDILTKKDPKDIEFVLNKLTTNYTYFYREGAHFDYFRDTVLPHLEHTKRDKVLSIWSAGCSSGQEPYTLSMLLKEHFGTKAAAWDTRVLATDISQNALSAAQLGVYDEESLSALPADWKRKYFKKTSEPGVFQVSDALKNNVVFRTFNLMDPIRFKLKFDVIFCRNVMIYFDQPTKDALIQRFYDATAPGGYLFIGHSESLNRSKTPYQYIMPAAYRKV